MLNMRQKQALTNTIKNRYQKAGKKDKTQILDEFMIHLKESEWRWNHRSENIYKVLLKILHSEPLF